MMRQDLVQIFNCGRRLVEDERNVELLCDRGVRQIFSDEFLYDNDSKRV